MNRRSSGSKTASITLDPLGFQNWVSIITKHRNGAVPRAIRVMANKWQSNAAALLGSALPAVPLGRFLPFPEFLQRGDLSSWSPTFCTAPPILQTIRKRCGLHLGRVADPDFQTTPPPPPPDSKQTINFSWPQADASSGCSLSRFPCHSCRLCSELAFSSGRWCC